MAEDQHPPAGDPSTEVKARRKQQSRAKAEPAPTPPAAPPAPAPVDSSPGVPSLPTTSTGISHHSLGGPAVMTGAFVSEGVSQATAGDYVVPDHDGFYAFYEKGARQPTVIRAWTAGLQVRRDMYDRYGGAKAARTPQAAVPINEPSGLATPIGS